MFGSSHGGEIGIALVLVAVAYAVVSARLRQNSQAADQSHADAARMIALLTEIRDRLPAAKPLV